MATFTWAVEQRAKPDKPWLVVEMDVEEFPTSDLTFFGEQKRIELIETEPGKYDFTDKNTRLMVYRW